MAMATWTRIGHRVRWYRNSDLEIHVCKYLIRDDVWLIYLLGKLMLIRMDELCVFIKLHQFRRMVSPAPFSICSSCGDLSSFNSAAMTWKAGIIQSHLLCIIRWYASARPGQGDAEITDRFRGLLAHYSIALPEKLILPIIQFIIFAEQVK